MPIGSGSTNRIHSITYLQLQPGFPQCLDYKNPTHGFIYIIRGLGCAQGLGHATQSSPPSPKSVVLHIIRARCAELGFFFSKRLDYL
jgi:hypothetical protein